MEPIHPTFSVEYLVETLGLPHNWDNTLVKVHKDEVYENRRWSEHHELIFELLETGKFYSVCYAQGLTDMQDESPWEFEKEVKATQVHEVEKTVKVWKSVTAEV